MKIIQKIIEKFCTPIKTKKKTWTAFGKLKILIFLYKNTQFFNNELLTRKTNNKLPCKAHESLDKFLGETKFKKDILPLLYKY